MPDDFLQQLKAELDSVYNAEAQKDVYVPWSPAPEQNLNIPDTTMPKIDLKSIENRFKPEINPYDSGGVFENLKQGGINQLESGKHGLENISQGLKEYSTASKVGIKKLLGIDDNVVFTIYKNGKEVTNTRNAEIASQYTTEEYQKAGFNVKSSDNQKGASILRGMGKMGLGTFETVIAHIPGVVGLNIALPTINKTAYDIAGEDGVRVANIVAPFIFGKWVGAGSLSAEATRYALKETGVFDHLTPKDQELAIELIANGVFLGVASKGGRSVREQGVKIKDAMNKKPLESKPSDFKSKDLFKKAELQKNKIEIKDKTSGIDRAKTVKIQEGEKVRAEKGFEEKQSPTTKVKIKEKADSAKKVEALEKKIKDQIKNKEKVNEKEIADAVKNTKNKSDVEKLEQLYTDSIKHNETLRNAKVEEQTKDLPSVEELNIKKKSGQDLIDILKKTDPEKNKDIYDTITTELKKRGFTEEDWGGKKAEKKAKDTSMKEHQQTQLDLMLEAKIPEEKMADYVSNSVADGKKLREYTDKVIEGELTKKEAADLIKKDFEKLTEETAEKPKPEKRSGAVKIQSTKDEILATIQDLQDQRKGSTRTNKMVLSKKIKREVEQLRALGVDAKYTNGKLTIDGKEIKPPKKMPTLSKPADIKIDNPLAQKSFKELPKNEVENQKKLVGLVTSDMLPHGIGKKAVEKGIRDVLEGRETTQEAQIVREHAKFIEKNGYHDTTLNRDVTPSEVKEMLNQKPQDVGEQQGFLFSKGKKKEEVGSSGAKKEPVKVSDIIDNLRKDFKVPIRTGRIGGSKSILGVYKPREDLIRIREADDMTTAWHEVAHAVDRRFMKEFKKTKFSQEIKEELKNLDYDQTQRRVHEGFAEFVRLWATEDNVQEFAPKTYDLFENKFLPSQPELAKYFRKNKELSLEWFAQGSLARAIGRMSLEDRKTNRLLGEMTRENLVRLNMRIGTNQLAGVEYAVQEIAKKLNRPLRPGENPALIANAVAKTGSAKAREAVIHGIFNFQGDQVGPSLVEVVKPIASKKINEFGYNDFQTGMAYAYAKHAKTLHNRGINPGLSLSDANYILEHYKTPRFEKFSEGFTDWSSHLLQYLADAGGLSGDAVQTMMNVNPFYIPLQRVFNETVGMSGGGKGFADLGLPVKSLKGSGRDVRNPLHSLIQMTEHYYSTADKLRVGSAFADLAKHGKGIGGWITEVPAPKNKISRSIEMLQSQLEKAGVDLKSADMDALIEIYTAGQGFFSKKDNIISLWRNGEKKYYELDPLLYESMKGMDNITLTPMVDMFLAKPTRLIRLGATGIRAGFSWLTNPIRDAQTFFLQSEHAGVRPDKVAKALLEELTNTGQYTSKFRRGGGEMAQPLGLDKRQLQKTVNDILVANDTKTAKALNVFNHPIDALREIFSIPEAGTRMAEFNTVMEKYKPRIDQAIKNSDLFLVHKLKTDAMVEGINASNEVTVNFKRMSALTKILNQLIPFYNPAVQGLSRMGRTVYQHPVRSGFRATALLTAPTLALWWMNKDKREYQELPEYIKYGFFNIEYADGKWLKIPKPFEWGYLFSAIPEAVANSLYHKQTKETVDAVKFSIRQSLPPVLPNDMLMSIGATKPMMEVYFNWDMFKQRNIISKRIQDIDPSLQYHAFTTPFAKKVAEYGRDATFWLHEQSDIFREIGLDFNISPIAIDHLLSGYTGGLAKDIVNGLPKVYKEEADIPVAGRMFVRKSEMGVNSRSAENFYNIYADYQKVSRTKSYQKSEKMVPIKQTTYEDFLYMKRVQIENTARQLLKLRKDYIKTLNNKTIDKDVLKKLAESINLSHSLTARNFLRSFNLEWESIRKRRKALKGDKIIIKGGEDTEKILRELP